MSAGMAGIIAAHSDVGVDPQSWAPGATIRWSCYSCGALEEAPSSETTKPEWHGQHLAEELTKAGYGNVQEALLAAADEMPIESLLGADKASVWLRERAQQVRA